MSEAEPPISPLDHVRLATAAGSEPEAQRLHAADPFGNRLEFLAEIDAAERVSADP